MKKILRLAFFFTFLFCLSLTAKAATFTTKPKSEIFKYYNVTLPTSGYTYEAVPFNAACNCAEVDMKSTMELNNKVFTVVFGVYQDPLGVAFSSSEKLRNIKKAGSTVKLINGNRWWYSKFDNGTEAYSYEAGHSAVGYRILVVYDKGIDSKQFKRLQQDAQKAIRSVRIIQKKPTEFPAE